MADDAFIDRPTEVYRQWLSRTGNIREDVGFEEGRLAMAMEIITVRRSLQAVGMLTTEMVSTLDALLADQGLIDTAEAMYEELAEWRRPKFLADADASLSPRRRVPRALGTPTWLRRDRTKDPGGGSSGLANEGEEQDPRGTGT
jgi:hypothetical protein